MKNKIYLFVLFFVSIIPLMDLLHPGLPITHDGQDHVARIANFYQNLKEGVIIPRWAANLNFGYGHPILMFLYPLPSYLVSLFHVLGFSFTDSTKLVFALAFTASGLTMYLWVKEFLNQEAGFTAAVLYMFAPYRFVDLYVRGAIGEHVAFVFPPLLLYFLLKLSKGYSYWYIVGGSFSFAFLLLSHNAISLMFLPIILLYGAFLFFEHKRIHKERVYYYASILMVGFGLASFFWLPALLEGKYTLRDIVIKGGYSERFVAFKDFLYGPWRYGISGQFTTQIGIVQWVLTILTTPLILYFRKKSRLALLSIIITLIFCSSLFLMTSSSDFLWRIFRILQNFQFPWRLLSVSLFASSVLGGIFVFVAPKKNQIVLAFSILILALVFNKNYWHAKSYLFKPDQFFTSIYHSTTDTGESSPIWSVRFMEHESKDHLETIDGSLVFKEIRRTSTRHEYFVTTNSRTRLRENTLYFPGWQILIDEKAVNIEFQDPSNRGVITFFVDKGQHTIKLLFFETKLRKLADMISLGSLVILIFYGILGKKIWQHFR